MSTATTTENRLVFRKTNSGLGRHISVTPANSANQHLSYGRIILDGGTNSVSFHNGAQETGFIVLGGAATVTVDRQSYDLVRHDGIYIPRDSAIEVQTKTGVDIAEFSSDVANKYPLQLARYAETSKNGSLTFQTGANATQRQVNIVLGKNVDCGRLVAGFTISEPGNWTSWPPHEHTAILEEMYVYFDMPAPAFAIQMVYENTEYPELVTVVRDGDAVLMPSGYHPNVSVPGHRICFLWAMAAHKEKEDRQFGVVNVQPDFAGSGSGLEASRK
jgi:5-deoxy-glucuronate isomerase